MIRNLKINRRILSLVVAWLTVFSANAVPDDTEIFIPPPGNPKVLFLLDAFDLLNGDNLLPDNFGDPYFVLSSGIAPPLDIVDTGGVGGSTLLAGTEAISLYDLLQPDVPNTFRRFVRTGWIELDD